MFGPIEYLVLDYRKENIAMAAKLIYLTDTQFNLLAIHLRMSREADSLNIDHAIMFMRDKFEEKVLIKQSDLEVLFSNEFQRNKFIEIMTGLIEVEKKEEIPVFEIVNRHKGEHIKIYSNGRTEGTNGTVINRLGRLK